MTVHNGGAGLGWDDDVTRVLLPRWYPTVIPRLGDLKTVLHCGCSNCRPATGGAVVIRFQRFAVDSYRRAQYDHAARVRHR